MRDYKVAVFIGRFQPFHKSHLEVVRQGLQIADKVVLIVGSNCATLTIKNPFTFEQRKDMIEQTLFSGVDRIEGSYDRVKIEPIRDFYEQDSFWIAEVQNIVSEYAEQGDSVCLLGSYKDASSYYINYFRNIWDFIPARTEALDATNARRSIFEGTDEWKAMVPEKVEQWITKNYIEELNPGFQDKPHTTGFRYQVGQYQLLKDYKKEWGSGPFITCDSVVIQGGHVLVIRRSGKIGRGRLAIPGGFLKPTERIEEGALRELREETNIKLDKEILRGCIVASRVFDYPGRSLVGRVVTHAYAIKLRDGNKDNRLVEVKGGDDASPLDGYGKSGAFWMNFNDINKHEDQFYDDHIAIIRWAWANVK